MKNMPAILMLAMACAQCAFCQTVAPATSADAPTASTPTTVPALLDAWVASEGERERFTLRYESTSDQDGLFNHPSYSRLSGKEKHHSQGEVRYDGERIFFSVSEWSESDNKNLAIAKEIPKQRTWLWDGRVHYFHTPGMSAVLTVGHGSWNLGRMVPTAIFRGYLSQLDDPVDVVVRRSGTSRLRPEPEMIDGSPCAVVEASGKEGRQTLWIDTQRGNSLAKAEVHLAEGDLLRGKPLEKGYRIDCSLSAVQLKKINGTWFPTGYAISNSELFPAGHMRSRVHCSFSGINLNPDLDVLQAFLPNMIEEGLLVRLPGINAAKPLTWHQGEVLDKQGQKVAF